MDDRGVKGKIKNGFKKNSPLDIKKKPIEIDGN